MKKRVHVNPLIPELFQLLEGLKEVVQDAQTRIADIEKMLETCLVNPDVTYTQAKGAFTHSPDFRSVFYKGVIYSFTTAQAATIQILYEQYKNNTPEVSGDYILTETDRCSQKLSDLFKKSPAWGQLIVPGNTRGTYRLNIS